jgi:hypothetical protein
VSTPSSYASAACRVKPITSRAAFPTSLSRPARNRVGAFIGGTTADLGGGELLRLRCVKGRNTASTSSVRVWTDEINGRHYRVLDALFVARGNRGWGRGSSPCLASVRGTASSGDNLAPRRADLSTTRADVLLRGWSGQDFPQACANLPTAYRM